MAKGDSMTLLVLRCSQCSQWDSAGADAAQLVRSVRTHLNGDDAVVVLEHDPSGAPVNGQVFDHQARLVDD